jgi:hypothetical protein
MVTAPRKAPEWAEAEKLWEACSSYTGANHKDWCMMNFVNFWNRAHERGVKDEIERCAGIAADSMNHAFNLPDAHMAEQAISILAKIRKSSPVEGGQSG